MLQQTTIHVSSLSRLNSKALGRPFAFLFLRPVEYAAECFFITAGIGFLMDFLLRFLPSPALESFWPIVLFRRLTDPALAPWRAALLDVDIISKDSYQAIPLVLSLTAWLVRPVIMRRLRTLRTRLEAGPVEALFLSHTAKTDGSGIGNSIESTSAAFFAGDDFSSARLIQDDSPQSLATPIVASAHDVVKTVGRYELVRELGRGPAGAVFRALDLKLGRTVALKILLPQGLSQGQLFAQKEKLYREARTAAKLMHPGIVTVYDAAEDNLGHPYIVMEFVDGETLSQALHQRNSEEPLSLAERLELAIQISKTLDYAHRRGIVHRDLKPSNVLLTSEGHAKIADFGIAMHLHGEVTEGGKVPGTPAFVAPELLDGASANAGSDIFSLGVLMYWMFTGEIPFSGNTVTEIVHQVAHANPLPARRLNWALPQDVDRVLRRCLAKKPAERYASAGEIAADLIALRDGKLENARLTA